MIVEALENFDNDTLLKMIDEKSVGLDGILRSIKIKNLKESNNKAYKNFIKLLNTKNQKYYLSFKMSYSNKKENSSIYHIFFGDNLEHLKTKLFNKVKNFIKTHNQEILTLKNSISLGSDNFTITYIDSNLSMKNKIQLINSLDSLPKNILLIVNIESLKENRK